MLTRPRNCGLRPGGFGDVTVVPFVNRYALRDWLRLTPIPSRLKRGLLALLASLRADCIKVGVNVGNSIAAGFKDVPAVALALPPSATSVSA